MPVFAYRVLDRRHTALTGTISADSPRQARDKLRARGLLIEEVRPQQQPRRSVVGWLLRKRGHAARMATLLRELATLLKSSRQVTAGSDIGAALEQTGVFPPVVVHVFSVGQASGRLEDMLDRLAATYDRQVNSLCNRLASVLEPILILVLAVFVGFILFATLLPILEAGNVF
jgi:type II secretory pathway component PulF